MALFFAPVANVVLSAVRPDEEGQASGANNAVRELGGVFGVAVLASIFSHYGGYGTGPSFVDGMTPAVYVGAAVVALGSLAAFGIRRHRKVEETMEAPVAAQRQRPTAIQATAPGSQT
jgi:predicted MFS family arabinose efflux permease